MQAENPQSRIPARLAIGRWFSQSAALRAAATALLAIAWPCSLGAGVADLEDVVLGTDGVLNAADQPEEEGFTSAGIIFQWTYNEQYQISSGFAASSISDKTNYNQNNPWEHPYNAITGSGAAGSSNYAAGYAPALVTLPDAIDPLSVDITNTTYAYYSMREGDGFAKKFGGTSGADPDWFLLTITGLDSVGSVLGAVEAYLADYRFEDSQQDAILDTWHTVDLRSLAGSTELRFTLSSSDTGEYGMNTPAYFALDNLDFALAGDTDDDGRVDLQDFLVLKSNFGTAGSREQGDLNADGKVDLADFLKLKSNFGEGNVAVAEPSSWLLAALGGLAALHLGMRRRPGRDTLRIEA